MPKFTLPDFNRINWRDWKTYVAILPVMIVFALWKPLESLRSRVWNTSRWDGAILHELLAIGAGGAAAITAAATPGLPFSHFLGHIGEGIAGFFLTWAYVIPIVWLLFLHPAWKGVKYCWDHFDFVDKNITGPLLKATVRIYSFLPGARGLWARVSDQNWFVSTVIGVSYVTAALSSLYIGWQAKALVEHSVHINLLTNEFVKGAAWAAGLLVAGFFGRLLLGAVDKGQKEGVSAIISAAATYASAGWLSAWAAQIGIPGWILIAFAYIVGAVYGLPLLYLVCASGFWKRLWKKIEPAYTAYFEGKATPFRHALLQLGGIALSIAIAGGCYFLCGLLALNVIWSGLVLASAFVVAYAFAGELLDEDYGNVLICVIGSLAAAVLAGTGYAHAGFVFGVYGGIAAGVITGLVTALVIPLAYTAVEWVAGLPVLRVATNWLGSALPALHKSYIDHVVTPTCDASERLYNSGYGHSNGKDAKETEKFGAFRKLALHGTNVAAAWTLTALAFAGVQEIHLLHAFEPIAGYALAALVLLLSFGLLGKAILSAGLELPGVVVSLLAGLKVGAMVLPVAAGGIWVAAPAGIVTAAITFGLGFPIVAIVLRAITGWAAPTLNIGLDWVVNKAWACVRKFWKGFVALFDFVYDLFEPIWKFFGRVFAWFGRGLRWVGQLLAPVWLVIAGLVAAGWNTCRGIWRGIFGGN
jgi:hypothetical protein